LQLLPERRRRSLLFTSFALRLRIAAIVAVGVSVVTFISEGAEFSKKILEVTKLYHEISKLRREGKKEKRAEQEENRLVRPPTAEEVKEYGASYIERVVRRHYRREEKNERLKVKPFITDSREDK
jgi:hypothetical protein